MDIEWAHILIDAALKSVVMVGGPVLLTCFSFRRLFSASERFTILLASLVTLLVLTLASMITVYVSPTNRFVTSLVIFAPEMSKTNVTVLTAIWAAGALPLLIINLTKILLGEWQCISQTSNLVDADRLPSDLTIRCPVLVDQNSGSPCVKGILFRRLFLPEKFFSWSAGEQRGILLHESFHLRRHDVFWQCLANFATVVFWFNPLIWFTRSCICLEQEISCDDEVLKMGVVDRATYSETILHVATDQQESDGFASRVSASDPLRIDGNDDKPQTRMRIVELMHAWNHAFHLQCRIFSIIDPTVCRRSLSLPSHFLLFLAVTSIVCSTYFCSMLFASSNTAKLVCVEKAIDATVDDAEEKRSTGSVSLDSRDLELGVDFQMNQHQLIGLRFADLPIPQKATIVSAKIVFTSHSSGKSTRYRRGDVDAKVFIQQCPDAPPFRRTSRNISRRLLPNQPHTDWQITHSWPEGTASRFSVELADQIQPLINDADWEPGNAIAFILTSDSTQTARSAASFDNTKSLPPPMLRLFFKVEQ